MAVDVDDRALSGLSKTVAIDILVNGAQSRASLGERLGVSAATVTRLVKPLLAADVLIEADVLRTPGRGRSAFTLDVVPERYRFIGIKLTTETMYAVVTDLRARIVDREVVALGSLRVPDVVETVYTAVRGFQARSGVPVDAVGVTVGGQVVDGEVVADSPFLHWHDVPFRSLLAKRVGLPVHLGNDVVGLTKVQHWFGYGRGMPTFALLTVGAGIGYGLVVNNVMVPTHVSPISHYPVDPSGPLCPLGHHRGCMTAYLASDSIAAGVSAGRGAPVTFDEALALAEGGDPVAERVVREAAHALGRTASAISSMTGVERIILSGEGVHLVEIARDAVEEGFRQYDIRPSPHDDIRPSPHADLVIRPMDFIEWARGAAALAIQGEFPG